MREGMREGIKKGIEEGRNKEKQEIAKNMLKENMSIEAIIRITGLSKKEIEELQTEK